MELNLERDFGADFMEQWKLFEVSTKATSKQEYLLRPDLGRLFNQGACAEVSQRCPTSADLQIVIGDGLSVTAIRKQVPLLLEPLCQLAKERGWTLGQPFVVRHCRVGILNQIGLLLTPKVVVLLIGERPGLGTAESLSAYLAYRPTKTDTDANRNLISNIHTRGINTHEASLRIVNLAATMVATGASGYQLRETLSAPGNSERVSKVATPGQYLDR